MRRMILGLAVAAMTAAAPVTAQVRAIDPNQGIDRDLSDPDAAHAVQTAPSRPIESDEPADRGEVPPPARAEDGAGNRAGYQAPYRGGAEARADATTQAASTYHRDDLLAAGEGVFGKGAEGLAGILEKILKDQGEPNAYIAGREASGAFVVGLRYGSGIMSHKVEGQQPVYWTGPSVGFDVGGDANKVFVLVYNLYDTADLFHRFPGAEGRLYFVGGFAATYLRRGNVVLIPIRLGVGWRAGVNVGYMNFTHKSKWLPF